MFDSFGYNEIVLKSDNEFAIKVFRDEVVNKRVRPTRSAGSVPMHLQTHRRAEKVVQDFIHQVRELKMGLERNVKTSIPVDKFVIHWIIEHATLVLNRHQLGHDGKTPYRRIHQKDAPASRFEFGEQVMARFAPKRSKTKTKIQSVPRSTQATWVGVHEPTAENIVVLQSGKAVRARTVFRRFDEERWNAERVLQTKATPNNPNPGAPEESITTLRAEQDNDERSGKQLPETPSHPTGSAKGNFKLARKLFDEHGYTKGCVVCDALQTGLPRRTYSTFCRTRIIEKSNKSEVGRKTVSDVEERLAHHKGGIEQIVAPQDAVVPDESDESGDEDEDIDEIGSVLAWLSTLTDGGCGPQKVKGILKKPEKIVKVEDVEEIRMKNTSNDVSEIYSFPPIAARVAYHGLRQGFSPDFAGNTPSGEFWDFRRPHLRAKAVEELDNNQLEMLILFLVCGPLGQLQG